MRHGLSLPAAGGASSRARTGASTTRGRGDVPAAAAAAAAHPDLGRRRVSAGSCLYKLRAGTWTPEDVRALRALVERDRPGASFDVALGGDRRGDDWEAERARIGALAEAGATWWVEYVPPDDVAAMREAVARGPLRVD